MVERAPDAVTLPEQTEVIVVGGGPAGTTAATIAAQQGRCVMLFERERFPRFHVGESLDGKTDEVTHTDGISILSKAVRNFPEGLLVVQDDDNVDQDGQQMNQNFKVVDWRSVARLIQN